ncbi:uncharacterized mitochondrial protein-like protein [Tanacetum coccineum]|uniref:Uncharacterized mitochondrial protein-like protein n=1 Tax=Tanacetum coccineum TaxID=301880 RepID=A0ABQ5FV43_9ASTR
MVYYDVIKASIEYCNATLYPTEKDLKLSKAEDKPEFKATNIEMCPRESHARAIKQILQYLRGTLLFSIIYNHSNDMKLVGYSDSSHNFDIDDGRRYGDSSHNFDIDDGRSTTGHIFYLGTSPITWCSQNQTIMALSSCEAEFMAATAVACQPIWLRELLAEVTGLER